MSDEEDFQKFWDENARKKGWDESWWLEDVMLKCWLAARSAQWQPIETAPKDGTSIDLMSATCRVPECYFKDGQWWSPWVSDQCGEPAPVDWEITHWRLMPSLLVQS